MDTLKKSKLDTIEIFALLIIYFVVLIGLLFAVIGLSEFYNVRLAGHKSVYAFGSVADNQWYYQNATIYSHYNLISGILFLLTFLISAWATIKKNRKILLIGVGLTGFLLLASYVSMGTQ